jgi:hypothetical protein
LRTGSYRIRKLCQAEIQYLDDAVRTDLHVGRFQVTMDDALLVSSFDRFGDLSRNRKCFIDGKRSSFP